MLGTPAQNRAPTIDSLILLFRFVIGDAEALDAVFNMPQVQPWDVSKSFIIEWPHSSKEVQLALAVEENYNRENLASNH
jgi:hypothetical protein